jgi:thiol-disulfide isomerase/thioredoxin
MRILKYLIIFSIIILINSCISNPEITQFKITGTVKNLDGAIVYLEQNLKALDSVIIKDGKFSLSARVWNNRPCEIYFRGKNPTKKAPKARNWSHPITIFAENGAHYRFLVDNPENIFDHIYTLETNSSSAKLYAKYDKETFAQRRYFRKLEKKTREKLNKAKLTNNQNSINVLYDSLEILDQDIRNVTLNARHELFKKSPNSYPAVYLLSEAPDLSTNTAFYIGIEKQLTKQYRESYYGKIFVETLAKLRTDLPIQIKLDAINATNKPFNFGDFKNRRFLVLDFWATWCAPCLDEMPSALKFEESLKSKNIGYVFLSYDSRVKTWQKKSTELGLTYSYRINETAKPYLMETLNMGNIPRYVVVDNIGNVLLKYAPSPSDPKFPKIIDSLLAVNK